MQTFLVRGDTKTSICSAFVRAPSKPQPGGYFLNRTAPNPRNPGRATTLVAVAALLLTALPLGALAANDPGQPDGLIVVVSPRSATLSDAGAVVSSIGGHYVFDFELVSAKTGKLGQPYMVKGYMVDVNTAQPDGGNGPVQQLLWTESVMLSSATSKGTIRIPADALAWNAEALHGLVLTIHATYDENGAWLHDGHYPGGHYNVATAEVVAQGRWADADRVDEGFTPVFVVDAQPMGLVQPGNPLLNPGFEAASPGEAADVPAGDYGFSGTLPPWILRVDEGDHVPHSTHERGLRGENGVAGSYARILYDARDGPRNLYFGQVLARPDAAGPGGWKGGSAVTVEYDVRVSDPNGVATTFASATTLHWGGAAQLEIRAPAGGVPVDGEWHHVRVEYGATLSGKHLTGFFLSLDDAFPAGSAAEVSLDNVVVKGASYVSNHPAKNDLVDGYTVVIEPLAGTLSQGQDAAARLVRLADGKSGYLFALGGMDYTSGRAEAYDLDDARYVVAKLLDESYVKSGKGAGQAGPADTAFVAQSDGVNAERLVRHAETGQWYFVAPGTLQNKVVVPWLFADVAVSDHYASTWGPTSEPVSGYYSAARNNLAGWSVADHMDYAFTPVLLSDRAGPSMAYASTLKLSCPAAGAGGSCAEATSPTLKLTLSSKSPFAETLAVKLVSRIQPSLVLATGTVSAPSGEVLFTLTPEKVSQLRATGNMSVMAIVTPGVFTEGATAARPDGSNVYRLDNLVPLADFTLSPGGTLTRESRITLADASRDTDGSYTRQWKVWYLGDATDDAVAVDGATPVATGSASTLAFHVPDDGHYRADLLVRDNDGAEATKSVEFDVANLAPRAALTGPATVRGGAVVNYTDASGDADGVIVLREWNNGTGWVEATPVAGKIEVVFPETSGEMTLQYRVTDDDGGVHAVSRTILIDAEGPVTTVTVPVANGLNGWHKTNPALGVVRADTGGSGVASTTWSDNAAISVVVGSAAFTRTVAGDGTHVIKVHSTDVAGNKEAPQTFTLKIDTTAPSVAQRPGPADGIGGAYQTGTVNVLSATASDAHSPVVKVEFRLVGGGVIGADTDGSNGYTATWDTTGVAPGTYEIDAIAHNEAGLFSSSRLRYVVYGPPSVPLPPDADGDKMPDQAELVLCERENPASVIDGTCAGGDWTAPVPAAVLAEILSHVPSDGDGDKVPDSLEAQLCGKEDPANPADGSCAGDDYAVPTLP